MAIIVGYSALTAAEEKLIFAAGQDLEADLYTATGQRSVVRGEVLRELCTDARPDWTVKGKIRLTGGEVRGRLDLAGTRLAHPVRFTDCVFEDRIDLRGARAEHPVEWRGGRTMAILADRFESDADLTIKGVTVGDTVSLHWANVRGDLRMSDSRLMPAIGPAIYGADLRVGGTVFLDGEDFHATGKVCLRSAHIEGQLDCRHARFSNPSGHSISADHLVLDGDLLCEQGFRAEGEVCLQWAQVRRLRATGGTFSSSTQYALHMDALRAGAGVYLDRGFHGDATVRLVGANITGELCCTEGTFDNPSGRALDAERIVVDDVYLDRGFTARGEVRFTDAQVRRQFNATNGEFHNDRANAYALDADGLDCGGEVYLNEGFHATGAVSLTGAAIEGELNCTGADFTNPDGFALFADGLTTPGMVYLDRGFRARGEVRFARATVGRQLVCTGGVFDNEHGLALDLTGLISPGDVLLNHGFRTTGEVRMRNADITRDLDFASAQLHGGEGLDARGLRVGGCLTWIMDPAPEGPVDLSFANVSRLDDTAESWRKDHYTLAGTTYRTTADSHLTPQQRLTWLRGTTAYHADAYHQLADSYRLDGDDRAAQAVAIECQRDLRKRGGLSRPSKAWNWFLDHAVGYGYRLHRPFLALLILGIVGGFLYFWGEKAGLILATTSEGQIAPRGPGGYPYFNPFAYSFQLLIPGLDLRVAAYWLPDSTKFGGALLMIYTWFMILIGWVAATAVVAGVSRIFRQR